MPYNKPTVKYRWRIGEIATIAKIETSAIRFYESKLDWLVPNYEGKNRGKISRSYTIEGVNNVLEVVYLRGYGLTIAGIQKAYDDKYLEDLLEFFGYRSYDTDRKD